MDLDLEGATGTMATGALGVDGGGGGLGVWFADPDTFNNELTGFVFIVGRS